MRNHFVREARLGRRGDFTGVLGLVSSHLSIATACKFCINRVLCSPDSHSHVPMPMYWGEESTWVKSTDHHIQRTDQFPACGCCFGRTYVKF